MNKLIKIILWSLASLVLIVVLAAILIPVLVNPNDYKDEIAQQVYQKTGRTLTIEGDINLSISLPLSVSLDLGKTELSNAKGFGDQPFAKIDEVYLYVAIMPLLTQNRLDIGEVRLNNMALNLIKNKDGKTNWADLSGEKSTPEKETEAKNSTGTAKSATEKASMPAIRVAGLSVKDARISWTDKQNNQHIVLSKANISISELIEDKPFDLEISTLIDSSNPEMKGSFKLSSSPTMSLAQQLFKLPKTQLTLDLTGSALPGGATKTTLGGDIVFDGLKQLLDINGMKLTSYEMVINGQFHAAKLDSAPEYNGKVSIEKFSPKLLAAALGAALPKMKQEQALSSADAHLSFKGNQNNLNISSLTANLDDTALTGTAAIKNFQKPVYGFDLKLNQLNLDYYTVAAPEQAASKTPAPKAETKKTASKGKPANAPIFPVEILRSLNLDGKLTIGQFIAGGAKMTNVVIVLKGKDGLVQLASLKADLYKGNIDLKTTLDARSNTPKLKIINELKGVQIGDLLQNVSGSQEITGTANISANITTAGNDKDRLIKNSNGVVKLLVANGHVKKLDVINTLRKAEAMLKGRSVPTQYQEQNTKFSELKGTFNIKNGVVKNNDLSSKSPVMELTGAGYADLPKEYLDYTLKVKLLNSLKIDEKSQGTDYRGKEIPYTIKGKFSELKQEANISKVLEQQAKKKVEEKLNEKLEEKFGDKFKGLLKF